MDFIHVGNLSEQRRIPKYFYIIDKRTGKVVSRGFPMVDDADAYFDATRAFKHDTHQVINGWALSDLAFRADEAVGNVHEAAKYASYAKSADMPSCPRCKQYNAMLGSMVPDGRGGEKEGLKCRNCGFTADIDDFYESVNEARGTVRITVKKDREFDEWVAVYYLNGKRDEGKTYYGEDKADAVATAKLMAMEAERAGFDVTIKGR